MEKQAISLALNFENGRPRRYSKVTING